MREQFAGAVGISDFENQRLTAERDVVAGAAMQVQAVLESIVLRRKTAAH